MDPIAAETFRCWIKQEKTEKKLCVLLTSHDPRDIIGITSKYVILKDGIISTKYLLDSDDDENLSQIKEIMTNEFQFSIQIE